MSTQSRSRLHISVNPREGSITLKVAQRPEDTLPSFGSNWVLLPVDLGVDGGIERALHIVSAELERFLRSAVGHGASLDGMSSDTLALIYGAISEAKEGAERGDATSVRTWAKGILALGRLSSDEEVRLAAEMLRKLGSSGDTEAELAYRSLALPALKRRGIE